SDRGRLPSPSASTVRYTAARKAHSASANNPMAIANGVSHGPRQESAGGAPADPASPDATAATIIPNRTGAARLPAMNTALQPRRSRARSPAAERKANAA